MAAAKKAECVEVPGCFAVGGRERISKMVQVKQELGHGIVHFKMVDFMGTWLAQS